MDQQIKRKKYLEAQIKTASKEQLLIMLYDGALNNCSLALDLIQNQKHEEGCEKLMKAQNIVAELISSLQFDKNQEVSKNLASLYGYVYIQLMEANVKHELVSIHNAIKILNDLKGTWADAFEKVGLTRDGRQIQQQAQNEEKPDKPTGLSVEA